MGTPVNVEVRRCRPGEWLGPVEPDTVAVLDVEIDQDDAITAVIVAVGPLLQDEDDDALLTFVAEEVQPRLERLVSGEALDDPWSVVSTGHLQLTLMRRWLPDV